MRKLVASELIEMLKKLIIEEGDLPVVDNEWCDISIARVVTLNRVKYIEVV